MKIRFSQFAGTCIRLRAMVFLFAFTVSSGACVARPSSPPPKNPALPEVGKTVYFKRHYSTQHLADNPGQKIETIVIELSKPEPEGFYYIYVRALMKGAKRPVYSGKGYLSEKNDNSDVLRFQLDREAGRFTLELHEEHVILRLQETDFLTLSTIDENYGQTGDDEQLISFKATDKDHSVFKLVPAADDEIDF